MTVLLALFALLSIISVSGVNSDYCGGYHDTWGDWIGGFDCPTLHDWHNEEFCCGSHTDKYCCDSETWKDHGYNDDTDNDGDSSIPTTTILSIIFGTVCLIFLAIIIGIIVICIGNKKGARQRRRVNFLPTEGYPPPYSPSVAYSANVHPPPPPAYSGPVGMLPNSSYPVQGPVHIILPPNSQHNFSNRVVPLQQ